MNSGPKFSASRQDAMLLGVLTLPFLLNDFANILVKDYRVWLVVDYALVKALPPDLGIKRLRFGRFITWTFTMTVLGIVLDQFGSRFFERLLPDTRLSGIPPITNQIVAQLDL